MTISFNQSLAGLSLLTGQNMAGFGLGQITVESRAVRLAKAQFTLPAVTPPWREKPSSASLSAQVSAIRSMASIIDKVRLSGPTLPPDVQTAFTTYRALDRLRMLAESSLRSTTSAAERAQLQLAFAKGMADLQAFLGGAPGENLTLAFGPPTRTAESVGMDPRPGSEVLGRRLVARSTDAVPGLAGNEKFALTLSRGTTTDTVVVDLAAGPQPPTLQSIVAAFNAAITALPSLDANGNPVLDANGNPVPRYSAKFEIGFHGDGWGLQLNSAIERVAINQVGAGDSLMVAAGRTALDAPTVTGLMRLDDPAGAIAPKSLATYAAVDRLATAEAKLLPKRKAIGDNPAPPPPGDIAAATTTRAIATDAAGFSYIVGTTAGDLGGNRGDGQDDLFLTKMDADGRVVWQRTLGTTGSAQGAAVTVAANGDIVVAGTVAGGFDGAESDGDMMVARFSASGDEKFATIVRATGADTANAVAVAADGSIYVGGRAATGTGDAFLARIDAAGRLVERRTIDSGSGDAVRALKIDSDGSLVALTSEGGTAKVRRIAAGGLGTDLGSISLGAVDARALAIAEDGTIAVAGATRTDVAGAQVNARSGDRDGFVTRLDAGLANARTSYIGSAGDDQVDSVAFMNGAIYVGGRTSGALASPLRGPVDGFVTRLNGGTGAIETTRQWGTPGTRTEAVRIAAAIGADSAVGALGFARGTINPENSMKLTAQTALRAGDEFSFRVNGGTLRRIVITADDTLLTLSDRIRRLGGANLTVTTPRSGDRSVLRITPKSGHSFELLAGRDGKDALAKLGMAPARLVAAPIPGRNVPSVRPGGNFGLDLSLGLNIADADSAKLALKKLEAAISTSQTGFRSLYWDDAKAELANGGKGRVSPYLAAQAARYQDALNRLGGAPSPTIGF